MVNIRRVVAIAWLTLCHFVAGSSASAAAADGSGRFLIDSWETEDGLPQNSVITLTQTRDGYLWLGTIDGLVRFDGVQFTVFDESNTPELKSSPIIQLFEDSQTNLWIGTESAGIAVVKEGGINLVNLGRGSEFARMTSMCEDAQGGVWLSLADGQLGRYWQGEGNLWRVDTADPRAYRGVIAEESGLIWVGTDWRLFAIDPRTARGSRGLSTRFDTRVEKLDFLLASEKGGHWRLVNGRVEKWNANEHQRDFGAYPWNAATRVAAACEDREGNLIVGTLGEGVYWFDAEGRAMNLSTNQGLSHHWVLSLQMDREGSLWVGTDGGGLNRVKRQLWDVAESTLGRVVQSVCPDAQGGLWIGNNEGGVGYWKEGFRQRDLTNFPVRAVFVDRSGRVWAGTKSVGLYQLQAGQFRPDEMFGVINLDVTAMHQDRAGQLWLGTSGGLGQWRPDGSKVFTTTEGLSAREVTAIADDAGGNLWIGTSGGGLNYFSQGRFTVYREQTNGLPSDNISSLLLDRDGVLWIGTTGRGLGRFHSGRWTHYTKREGLVSNSIGYLIEDDEGFLWIGSNAGLMRVPKKALNDFASAPTNSIPVRSYGKSDGLPTGECTRGSQPAGARTRDGTFWFPTIKGLAFVKPAELRPNTNPPPVVIEAVLIDGEAQGSRGLRAARPGEVTISPGEERVEIHYTSLNLAAPERAQFKYRLEGHETDWTDAGDIRVARYSLLPPGEYRFRVIAANEDGVWNESGAALALTVLPPFWRTWWFLGAMTICLLGAIVAVVHYFSTQKLQRQLAAMQQKEALERERSRIARDLHDQLGANLTQVALLGELAESDKEIPDEVESHARQISQTARETTHALDEIVWAANPSNDTLEALVNYACKYAQDYLAMAGLRYRLDVTPQLPDISVPPEVRHNLFLAFKEAVNNVVKHAQASEARIRLKLDAGRFALEIEDDGRGIADSDPAKLKTRNGLRNMRKRMEDIGGEFFIGTGGEGGTLVRLTAPMAKS